MASVALAIPTELHPNTAALVIEFANAMAQKLYQAQVKHGFSDDWARDLWEEKCQADLVAHVRKGDPRDVAIYAAFMWKRGWKTVWKTA